MKASKILSTITAGAVLLSLAACSDAEAVTDAAQDAQELFEETEAAKTEAETEPEETEEAAEETEPEETEPEFDTSVPGNFILTNSLGIDINSIIVFDADGDGTEGTEILSEDLPTGDSVEISLEDLYDDSSASITVDGDEVYRMYCFPAELFAEAELLEDEYGTYYVFYTDAEGSASSTLIDEQAQIALNTAPAYSGGSDQDQGCVGDDALFY